MKRTLLVGLDAACWEYLDPLLKSGRLPAIQKLIDTGYRGTLTSTMPPWTPTAWSSLVTAKNPGKHGIFDMFWRRPGSYDFALTNATIRRGTPFWAYLNDAGVRVGLVNVPFTHPPVAIDGFILCGFGTPESAGDLTWPPEALASIEAGYGKYRPIVSPLHRRPPPNTRRRGDTAGYGHPGQPGHFIPAVSPWFAAARASPYTGRRQPASGSAQGPAIHRAEGRQTALFPQASGGPAYR